MGAAATFEMSKPVDAHDILASNSLAFAKGEVIRLREALGHLAKLAGIDSVVYDASDIVLGASDEEDFERCVREVAHIRQCLQLHTQNSRRRTRVSNLGVAPVKRDAKDVDPQDEKHADSDSSDSDRD